MAIVRELLIKLGFVTDKKAIKETNNAITGFKTRFAIAATAATYAFRVIKSSLSEIATATLDADALARTLGLSLEEFNALKKGFSEFRLNDAQATEVLKTLQKDLDDFRLGIGRVPELLRHMGTELAKDATPQEWLEKIIKKLQEFENDTQRIAAANIFFPGLGPQIVDLSNKFEKFKSITKEAYDAVKDQPTDLNALREYEKTVESLVTSFKGLIAVLAPAIEQVLKYLTYVAKFWSTLLSGDFKGFKGTLEEGSKKVDSIFGAASNLLSGIIDKFNQMNPYSRENQRKERYLESLYPGPTLYDYTPEAMTNHISNTVAINVPPGTTTEQAQYLGNEMDRLIEESIYNTWQRIQNNNPRVE